MSVFEKYNKEVGQINGWYRFKPINQILESIHLFQRQNKIFAGVAEIGVFQGKSFIPLSILSDFEESRISIDSFGSAPDSDGVYGDGKENKAKFLQNYFLIVGSKKLDLIEKDSKLLTEKDILNISANGIRMFSIDGDHSREGTFYDLRLAKKGLCDRGIILIDDYTNSSWPGVREGVDLFLKENKGLNVLYYGFNKLILSNFTNNDELSSLRNTLKGS